MTEDDSKPEPYLEDTPFIYVLEITREAAELILQLAAKSAREHPDKALQPSTVIVDAFTIGLRVFAAEFLGVVDPPKKVVRRIAMHRPRRRR